MIKDGQYLLKKFLHLPEKCDSTLESFLMGRDAFSH
jgi:hypothetical protein